MMSWNKSCMSWHPLKEWDNKSEGKRLVFACHLSSSLTLGLITASPLANAPSLGTGSMCNLHKRWEICTKNASWSHNGIRKSVWCERQFTLTAKRSFCFSFCLKFVHHIHPPQQRCSRVRTFLQDGKDTEVSSRPLQLTVRERTCSIY